MSPLLRKVLQDAHNSVMREIAHEADANRALAYRPGSTHADICRCRECRTADEQRATVRVTT